MKPWVQKSLILQKKTQGQYCKDGELEAEDMYSSSLLFNNAVSACEYDKSVT